MPTLDAGLHQLDLFLRTYPVRVQKSVTLGGVPADYYCPLAGIAVLLVKGARADARKPLLTKQGITVLTLKASAIARNPDAVCAFLDAAIRHALTHEG